MARLNYKEVLKGDKGTTFIPHINSEGFLYWTNDGDLINPPPVKIKGSIESVDLKFKIDERGHLIVY